MRRLAKCHRRPKITSTVADRGEQLLGILAALRQRVGTSWGAAGRTGVRDRTGTKKMWGCLKSMGTPPLLQWSRTSISPVKVAFFLCGGISSFRHTRKFPYILLAISFIYCVTLCNYIPLHPPNISMTTVPINLDDWTSPFFMVIGEMVISPLYTIKSSMCLHLYPFVLVQESWLMW